MVKRNPHFAKLQGSYLFPEINKRRIQFLEKNPKAHLINLGIGDTTQPIPPEIIKPMEMAVKGLGTAEGYYGYGPEQGYQTLRKLVSQLYQSVEPDEVFISDGSKCDIGRIQTLFGNDITIAVQDPSYPVYVDTSVMLGQTENYNKQSCQYDGIVYMRCDPNNNFFPNLKSLPHSDIIYFCSPNNPTGAVATREQLIELVAFAKKRKAFIIFDAAYASYIQDPTLPKSIYEIEEADEVAIELGSFSKMIGFTGVRLAWCVVPKKVKFETGESAHSDFLRLHTTAFNGASFISQMGGLATLQPDGKEAMKRLIQLYLSNAKKLKHVFEEMGYPVYGGEHAPYLWVKTPYESSWQAFEEFLEKFHLISTPGIGFGPAGEGFLRFSALGHPHHIEEAMMRLKRHLSFAGV